MYTELNPTQKKEIANTVRTKVAIPRFGSLHLRQSPGTRMTFCRFDTLQTGSMYRGRQGQNGVTDQQEGKGAGREGHGGSGSVNYLSQKARIK